MITIAKDQNLVGQLEERAKEFPRTMVFFRWYGMNVDTFVNIPALHEPWKYIQTIGVSVFNKKVSTSKHFGYLRASLRILYNLNDMKDPSAYIQVGDTINYWCENKLFIFDDTLLHISVNETNEPRYCLFVDIIRPTPFPAFMRAVVFAARLLTHSFKFIYYNNWKISNANLAEVRFGSLADIPCVERGSAGSFKAKHNVAFSALSIVPAAVRSR